MSSYDQLTRVQRRLYHELIAVGVEGENAGRVLIYHLPLTEADFSAVFEIVPNLPELRELTFLNTTFNSIGLMALVRAARRGIFSEMEILELDKTQIDSGGVISLVEAAIPIDGHDLCFPRLQRLLLEDSLIGEEAIVALAKAIERGAFSTLKQLELNRVGLTEKSFLELARLSEKGYLSQLEWLWVDYSELGCVSLETLSTGNPSLIFQTALYGVASRMAKGVVLGEGGAGKSWCCCRAFLGKDPKGIKETHGFAFWEPKDWSPQIAGQPVKLRVWDFGGQQILHGTHEMFLSGDCVCLLVVNHAWSTERNRLQYWTQLVRHYLGPDANVMIIETQCDEVPYDANPIAEDDLQSDFDFRKAPLIIPAFSAEDDSFPGNKVFQTRLNEALARAKSTASVVPRELPELIKKVELQLQHRSILPLSEFRQWCAQLETFQVTDSHRQDSLLRILHHLGILFYFYPNASEQRKIERDAGRISTKKLSRFEKLLRDADDKLRDWVISPVWLCEPLYEIVRNSSGSAWQTDKEIKEAIKRADQLQEVTPVATEADLIKEVLQLTRLCIKKDGNYFFPRGLKTPQIPDWADLSHKDLDLAEHRELIWPFFHDSALHRLIVRWFDDLEYNGSIPKCWENGMIVKTDKGVRAAVVAEPDHDRVWIHLRGVSAEARGRLFEMLCNDLETEVEEKAQCGQVIPPKGEKPVEGAENVQADWGGEEARELPKKWISAKDLINAIAEINEDIIACTKGIRPLASPTPAEISGWRRTKTNPVEFTENPETGNARFDYRSLAKRYISWCEADPNRRNPSDDERSRILSLLEKKASEHP